jgi:hypothetical protein
MNQFEKITWSRTMKQSARPLQRGQAMSEFIVAMAVFAPLFFGVIYIGKYSDIKHQAIQASRYAALERAMDPNAHDTDAVVKDDAVARFFWDNGQHQNIGRADRATAATSTDENPLWGQANGSPMLGQYSDVRVTFTPSTVSSLNSSFTPLVTAESRHLFNSLPSGGVVQANVEVPVANITHFAPLQNINLTIGATTVIAGDPWNADGAGGVADHFPKSPASAVPARGANWLTSIPGVNQFFKWFAGADAPTPGCLKPEIVPDSVAPGASYDSNNDQGNNACL